MLRLNTDENRPFLNQETNQLFDAKKHIVSIKSNHHCLIITPESSEAILIFAEDTCVYISGYYLGIVNHEQNNICHMIYCNKKKTMPSLQIFNMYDISVINY